MASQLWQQTRAWFIHLFTPHCDECIAAKQCKRCDELFQLLERERAERTRLILLLTSPGNTETAPDVPVDYSNIGKLPWRAKREQLERDSFRAAHAVKEEM